MSFSCVLCFVLSSLLLVGALDSQQISDIVKEHNDARSLLGSSPIVWDPAIAKVAQSWSDKCTGTQSDRTTQEKAYATQLGLTYAAGDARFTLGENFYASGALLTVIVDPNLQQPRTTLAMPSVFGKDNLFCGIVTQMNAQKTAVNGNKSFGPHQLRLVVATRLVLLLTAKFTENWNFLVCHYNQAGNSPGQRPVPSRVCPTWNDYLNGGEGDKIDRIVSLIKNSALDLEIIVIEAVTGVIEFKVLDPLQNSFALFMTLLPENSVDETVKKITDKVNAWIKEREPTFDTTTEGVQISILESKVYKKREFNHIVGELEVGFSPMLTFNLALFLLLVIFLLF